ncbi:serine/threonine protein kinase [Microcoleus sp. FACHB-1515]|uniref:serine/threonine-protein kinase n=1 Tax=Cyanophyceae TaxID=3028117 RepID=UPI00168601EE|nr:serine/threonine-protein kinase [Microcoleus sp. FACHB-1515]MBD2088753.1 serine/threonine protein kinase [Microcoleus sp. FACHB-1515]
MICINPHCFQPDHPGNDGNRHCQSCGAELLLQNRYRVVRLISDRSGFGRVYDAIDLQNRAQPKILKILKEVHSTNPKAVELFRQEAIVLSQLHHPGIPAIEPDGYFQVHLPDLPDPLHCLVMEKIDGPNLREWMQQQGNNPIGEKQALNWLMQLTEVLHQVHQKNYFHRDIKPENIMLRSNGQLVLVDFGAAREMTYTYLAQLGGGSSGVTRISSAGYTPPEQEQGQAVPQSDFYALGRTFIYLLTGRQPSDQAVYDSLHNQFHWREHAPHLSPQWADLIDRLSAPKAVDRPNNTQEILDALVQVARSPNRVAASNATTVLPSSRSSLPVTQVEKEKPPVDRRWIVGGAIALVLSLGGVSLWQFTQHQQSVVTVNSLRPVRSLAGHTGFINCLAISPDGQSLMTGSADFTIRLWNLATGQTIRTLQGHQTFVNAIETTPNGRTLISGDADGEIKLWNLATGQATRSLQAHARPVNAIDINPNGSTIATGSADNTVKLWNTATGTVIHTLSGHSSSVNAIDFSPDGKLIVSGSADNTVKLWDVATGNERRTFSGHTGYVNAVLFSLDGKTLISASADNTIKVWDTETGQILRTLTGHTSFVNSIDLQINGKTLISSGADETIRLWNLETGTEIRKLTASDDMRIDYFAISSDWKTIATGRGTTAIEVWELPR